MKEGRKSEFRFPRDDEHITIVGRTGTGKTQAGAFVLAKADLKARPWFILDFKDEPLLNSIPRLKEVSFKDNPTEPGLYILHSRPDLEEETEAWLWRRWDQKDNGIFIDEGYMLPEVRKGAFAALLTQGRSRKTPVITLSQRPVRVNRTAFSEASHIMAFDLNDRRDHKSLEEICPSGFMDLEAPPFHSRWYSVKSDLVWRIGPVPDGAEIVDAINEQLPNVKRWL